MTGGLEVEEGKSGRGASAWQRAVGGDVDCGEWQAVKHAGKKGREGARMWGKMDTGQRAVGGRVRLWCEAW